MHQCYVREQPSPGKATVTGGVREFANSDGSNAAPAAIPKVRLDRLSIGSITFRDVIAPSRDYNSSGRSKHIDGIIGFGLFEHCVVTLNYLASTVTFARGTLERSTPQTVRVREIEGNPHIDIDVGSKRADVMFDTGDRESFTFAGRLASDFALGGAPKVVGTGRSANKEFEIRESRLIKNIRIGTTIWPQPLIQFADGFSSNYVGSGSLQDTVVQFDKTNGLMRIQRPLNFQRRSSH